MPGGTHEPVILLIAPSKQQMYVLGGEWKAGKHTLIESEISLSVTDVNTFSSRDASDDAGYAARFMATDRRPAGKSLQIVSGLGYEWVHASFKPVERYRNVEFERDWNLSGLKAGAQEHAPVFKIGIESTPGKFVTMHSRAFVRENIYNGWTNSLDAAWDVKNFFLTARGSYLISDADNGNSRFLRHKAVLLKKFRHFNIGIREEQEDNRLFFPDRDSLSPGSSGFFSIGGFVSSGDSSANTYLADFSRRKDLLPVAGQLKEASEADEAVFSLEMRRNPANTLRLSAGWRSFRIKDTSLILTAPENTLLGRLEFFTRKFKDVLSSTTFL
jgi:hypothetical protein